MLGQRQPGGLQLGPQQSRLAEVMGAHAGGPRPFDIGCAVIDEQAICRRQAVARAQQLDRCAGPASTIPSSSRDDDALETAQKGEVPASAMSNFS